MNGEAVGFAYPKKKSLRALLETPWNKIVQNHQSQKVELLGKGLPVNV